MKKNEIFAEIVNLVKTHGYDDEAWGGHHGKLIEFKKTLKVAEFGKFDLANIKIYGSGAEEFIGFDGEEFDYFYVESLSESSLEKILAYLKEAIVTEGALYEPR